MWARAIEYKEWVAWLQSRSSQWLFRLADPGRRMKADFLVIVAVFLAVLVACRQDDPEVADEQDLVGVATVVDGDTIEIHGKRIRLSGIDAPERGRECTDASGAIVRVYQTTSIALDRFIAGRSVRCARDGNDGYGRVVARCRVGGTDIASWMVANGHAWDWPKYSKGRYAPEESRARAAKAGLWSLECPNLLGDRTLK